MNIDEFFFKKILNLTNIFLKKNEIFLNYIFLENYLSRFIIFSCSIFEDKIDILSDDYFGGYINNTLFLPCKVNLSNDKNIDILLYIYKILFLLISKKFKFVLSNNININSYENSICSLLIINSIHIKLIKNFPMIFRFIFLLYPIVTQNRNKYKLNDKFLIIIDFIIKKLMFYKENKNFFYNLSLKEKYFVNYVIKNYVNNNIELQLNFFHILNYLNKISIKFINNFIFNEYLFNILWGRLLKNCDNYINSNFNELKKFSLSSGKEYKSKLKNEVKIINYKENINKDNPIIKIIDHVKTVENYKGGFRDTDGSDEIEEHLDAMNEIDFNQITRSSDQTKSIFSMDVLNVLQNDLKNDNFLSKSFLYNEWDFFTNKYKLNWCKIYNIHCFDLPIVYNFNKEDNIDSIDEKKIINNYIKKNKKDIEYLSFCLKKIFNMSIWLNRQVYGPEIDIDSLTIRYAFLFSGNCNFENFYLYKKNLDKKICILVLIDSSLSTDSWFKGKKISIIIKEIVIILCESLNKIFNNFFAVSAFYSNTRNDCKYIIIKNFENSWNVSKIFLCRIIPIGYTRIGPAIRHSIYYMNKIKIKYKLLLLISDTKPTDYDLYEGNYGILDVKKCVYEALVYNIKIKTISIDDKSKFYLPKMFGKNNYYLLKDKIYIGKLLSQIFFDCFVKK
ncbi:MAG TPA: hypothetical protein V8P47_01035 [Candidatus Azosocius sp. HAIN]